MNNIQKQEAEPRDHPPQVIVKNATAAKIKRMTEIEQKKNKKRKRNTKEQRERASE